MHWYVGFRDPVPAPGHEPAPFEWAGGLPALTRMSRLLYEKHVPADALLAPLFADMPPDQPQRLAAWLAGALGGPPAPEGGDFRPSVIGPSAVRFTEEQRTRWAALAGAAADEAMLPADPAFRSVFSACVDWASRTALAQPDTGRRSAMAPRWGWGPGGPPTAGDADREADQADASAEPLPGPDQQVSFAAHIKPLFRERDRQSMSFAFDLWSAGDVRGHATDILKRLQDGSMPCDGAWPAARIEVFQRWTETGMQP
jgi:truncated hemoglobin YjbI